MPLYTCGNVHGLGTGNLRFELNPTGRVSGIINLVNKLGITWAENCLQVRAYVRST